MNDTPSSAERKPLVSAAHLRKCFRWRRGLGRSTAVAAVDDVSFDVFAGQTVALVGESGSGKSTVGKILLGLMPADGGEVFFEGEPVTSLSGESWVRFRRSLQMVFQSPLRSFSPMLSVGGTLRDALRLREQGPQLDRDDEVAMLLKRVQLSADFAQRYPAEMSGGQLQRAGIARALAPGPRVIFLDEPTSALDMSLRGLIINLLLDLQAEEHLAYVLVAHDLRIVRAMVHHVLVMYLGQVLEESSARDLFASAYHPYTLALLAAAGMVEHLEEGAARVALRGEVKPLPADYRGCKLYNRCPFAVERCTEPQVLVEMRERHAVRCWRASEIAAMLTARKPAAAQHDVMESVSGFAISPRKVKQDQP